MSNAQLIHSTIAIGIIALRPRSQSWAMAQCCSATAVSLDLTPSCDKCGPESSALCHDSRWNSPNPTAVNNPYNPSTGPTHDSTIGRTSRPSSTSISASSHAGGIWHSACAISFVVCTISICDGIGIVVCAVSVGAVVCATSAIVGAIDDVVSAP